MIGTLVDSNVLLDLFTEDPVWSEWSATALARCADAGPLYINPLMYGEISIRFSSIEALDASVPEEVFRRLPLPMSAAFLAGKAYVQYRQRGGLRSSILPDFYIGAHAVVADLRLLTRDATRFRTYFPTVTLIAP